MRLVETWCKNTSHKTDTVSAPWFRRRGCSRCGGEIWRRPIHGLERLCSLSVLLPAGLISMVEFRFGDAFIHEAFIVTSPVVVFIFAGSGRHFMSGGTSHRIPAFRFGRGIKHRLFWIHFRFARQFPFGLFPMGFETSCAERPLMTASSIARSRTIFRVTVPMPSEFSVKAPCFSGLVFMAQRLPRVKCLAVVRGFHFARAAILARVAGLGKNVVPFWRL